MRHDETGTQLRSMLVEAGVDPDRLDMRSTWNVFKQFAGLPVEDVDVTMEGDQLLFQTWVKGEIPGMPSNRDPSDRGGFQVLLDRQFSFYDTAGEYLGMNALSVTVQFDLTPELRQFPREKIWGVGGSRWPDQQFDASLDWVRRVEASRVFRLLLERHTPIGGFLRQGPM